jgi:HAD superfamily hydrolase (TIGR01490 family)
MASAALFDMDRTLVRKETASLYVRYMRRRGAASWRDTARVLWWVAQYTAGVIDAPAVAGRALRWFAGMEEKTLAARCEDWFHADVLPHVSDVGRRAVTRHRESGDVVAIVTGASPYSARPLARHLGIEHVVASELEVGPDGRFTGRYLDPLCYGDGKLTRARGLAERLGFALREATFYTDSLTDLPLLEAVRTPVAVNPDMRLARLARRRGWRIERW